MAKKEVVVIGIGRFATALIDKLNRTNDFSVVAIDKEVKKLEQLKGVKNIIVGDATDEEFLTNIGVDNADYFVIGMGQDFKASLVIASIIKENFKGKLFAKSVDPNHENILNTLGVEEVITPEVAAAGIVYRRLLNPLAEIKGGVNYQMVEVAAGVSIVNVPALKMDWGKTIKEIEIAEGIGIALINKVNGGPQVVTGDTLIEEGDVLAIIGQEPPLLKLLDSIHDNKIIEEKEKEEMSKDTLTKVTDALKYKDKELEEEKEDE